MRRLWSKFGGLEPIPTGLPGPEAAVSRPDAARNLVGIARLCLLGFRAAGRETIRFRLGNPYWDRLLAGEKAATTDIFRKNAAVRS